MSAETVTTMDLIERRQAELRDATATGDARRIDRAARALERARESAARAASRARDRQEAQRRVDQERRDADRAEKKRVADAVEAELRSAHEPYADVHAAGKVIRVRLGHEDDVARGFAVEAVRRVAYQAVYRFQDRVVGSRNAGAPVAESDWLSPMMGASHGLLHAGAKGLVTVRDEEQP